MPLQFRIDTSADVDVTFNQVYSIQFSHKVLLPANKHFKGPDKELLQGVLGYIKSKLCHKDKTVELDIYIVNGASSIPDWQNCIHLGLVALVGATHSYCKAWEKCTGL